MSNSRLPAGLTSPRPWVEVAVTVPSKSGIYAWYIRDLPRLVPTGGCEEGDGAPLVYVGIAPSRPGTRDNLKKRLQQHFSGNAEGSTLRLTLGCLLSESLGIELYATGSSGRLTFGDGEGRLSSWMREHARVAFMTCDEPWKVEEELIQDLDLPLNLKGNERNPFHPTLKAIRSEARARARRRA
jgi:hypothetical protein